MIQTLIGTRARTREHRALLYPGEGPVPRKVVNARAEGRVRDVGRSPQLFKEKPVPTRVGY